MTIKKELHMRQGCVPGGNHWSVQGGVKGGVQWGVQGGVFYCDVFGSLNIYIIWGLLQWRKQGIDL